MSLTESGKSTTACEALEWDSAFFERRIARFLKPRCRREDAAALRAECLARAIDCAYVLADVADTESIAALQHLGAYFADIRVTFGTHAENAAPAHTDKSARGEAGAPLVRAAVDADIPALMRIAAVSHRDTRFYADDHFDPVRCNHLYEVWIENSCRGYADAVFVADGENGEPSGYVTCHQDALPRGHVGLFAVREGSQGRGNGKALLESAIAWFAARDITDVTVATQARNVRALQFYSGAGLSIRSVGLWFHYWPRDREGRL